MGLPHTKTAELKQQVFAVHRKSTKRAKSGHAPKATTVAAYMGVFLLTVSMVAIGYQPPERTDKVASVATAQSFSTGQPSVDQLVATSVAVGIAERANLPIADNVANLSVSLSAESQLAQGDGDVISKPQIIQPSADSRAIQYYTAKAGDTVDKVARQYGVSNTTIKWANDLSSDALEPNQKLMIPPVDGVVYTVQSSDTIESIASKYDADVSRIIAFNDLELSGVKASKKIIIPGGNLPAEERPGYIAAAAPQSSGYTSSYGYGGVNPTRARAAAGNAYAFGYCTYYVYDRRAELGRPIGSFWGNASTWAMNAAAAGFRVDNVPEVGAIVQWNAYAGDWIGYAGHVGVVESINSDGTITISEMNNTALGGWNIVNKRNLSPAEVSNFIH